MKLYIITILFLIAHANAYSNTESCKIALEELPPRLKQQFLNFFKYDGKITIDPNSTGLLLMPYTPYAMLNLKKSDLEILVSQNLISEKASRTKIFAHELKHATDLNRIVRSLMTRGFSKEKATIYVWNKLILARNLSAALYHQTLESRAIASEEEFGIFQTINFWSVDPHPPHDYEKVAILVPAHLNAYPEFEAIRYLLPRDKPPKGLYNSNHTDAMAIEYIKNLEFSEHIPPLIDQTVEKVLKIYERYQQEQKNLQPTEQLEKVLSGLASEAGVADSLLRFSTHIDHSYNFHIVRPLIVLSYRKKIQKFKKYVSEQKR